MPKERVVEALTFSYSGLLTFKKFYNDLKSFWDSKGFDFIEKSHEEKISEDGTRSFKVAWSCEKKITDYAKYTFEININIDKIRPSGDREYVENMVITVNGDLEFDFNKYFGNKPFNMFLRALFERYIYSGEYREHKKNISKIANDFINLAKQMTASYTL